MREDLIISSKCRNLLQEHTDVLEFVINEIKEEAKAPINKTTVEEIALEYKHREGMRHGVTLLMQKLNTKANVRED